MNILVFTTVYPCPDADKSTTATKVVKYFADEWKRAGHNVVVVHTVNRLMYPVYFFPPKIKDYIKGHTGFEIPSIKITKQANYEIDGVTVFRKPIFKLIPKRLSFAWSIGRLAKSICSDLVRHSFVPDLIVGHWSSPTAQMLYKLKDYYTCPNAIVFHSQDYTQRFKRRFKKYLSRIDKVGCRSNAISEKVMYNLDLSVKPFVCYSGIPEDSIPTALSEKPIGKAKRFLYVGELIERKNVDTIIESLSDLSDYQWSLEIVGVGNEEKKLKKLVEEKNVTNRVDFHGRIPRKDVLRLMSECDVFTMVSRDEAFGLVYLEAMSSGCITIGSYNEGIDGVIVDGENGFLCTAGNKEELSRVYNDIFNMDDCILKKISYNAYETAKKMTDSVASDMYLRNVLNDR